MTVSLTGNYIGANVCSWTSKLTTNADLYSLNDTLADIEEKFPTSYHTSNREISYLILTHEKFDKRMHLDHDHLKWQVEINFWGNFFPTISPPPKDFVRIAEKADERWEEEAPEIYDAIEGRDEKNIATYPFQKRETDSRREEKKRDLRSMKNKIEKMTQDFL